MFKILKIGFSFLFFLTFAFSVQAANSLNIVINEIIWMGTEVSYSNEWIELYNNADEDITLDSWTLRTEDGTPTINLAGEIPANDFFLLERTDDNTLPDISADQIYKGALDNSGEILELYDNLGDLIDSVNCSAGWFAGDNETKQTMERKDPKLSGSYPNNWQTSENPGGTPKAKNSLARELTENGSLSAQLQEMSTVYPSRIIINEILPSPEGPDAEEEWTEIFNQNDFEVDISGWQVKDTVGKTKTYAFPEGTKIKTKGFLLLPRPTIKITLNNGGDGLSFIQPDKKIVDEVNYNKAQLGQSYNRTESGWAWSNSLTPDAPNIVSAQISKPEEETKEEEIPEIIEKKGLAAIGEQIPKKISSFPLLVASVIAIFSAVVILVIKKNLSSKKSETVK